MKNDYQVYEEVARGKQSVIYKARRKKKLQFVAIKKVNKCRKEKVLNEGRILKELIHPNVLRFYDYNETKNHLWVITEYCPGGDLLRLFDLDRCFEESVVQQFAREIVLGLHYVHKQGIILADLKPASVLLNEYGTVKLSGFGSAILVSEVGLQTFKKGTPSYMAPELFQVIGVHSYASDLWALGCLLHQLATGTPPFLSSSIKEIMHLALTADTPQVSRFSKEFNVLLNRLLAKKAEERIQWSELKEDLWLGIELPITSLPSQPAFDNYLRKRSSNRPTQMVRMSQQLQGGYGEKKQVSATDRRLQFVFQSDVSHEKLYDLEYDEEDNQPIAITESANVVAGIDQLAGKQFPNWEEVLQHQSDLAVKPIIGNKEIEVVQKSGFNKKNLGFEYIDPEVMAEGVLRGEMKEELRRVLEGMGGDEKQQVLCYFESIIQNSDIANYLFKSTFVPHYLRYVKGYKQAALRAKMCQVLGLLIRHATVIDPDILRQGIVPGLLDAVKDKNEKVRRKAMAALGELLFYGATQVDQKVLEWDISVSLIHSLLKILKNVNEDEVVKFYCCKSIQNITAQAHEVGTKFAQLDSLMALINSFQTTGNEYFRSSIAACLHHIIVLNEALREVCVQKLTISTLVSVFRSAETQPRTQQILLWLLVQQYGSNPKGKVTRQLLSEEALFIVLLPLLDSTNVVVRGRVFLCIHFQLQSDVKSAAFLLRSKLFLLIDRQTTHRYQLKCLQFVLLTIFHHYPSLSQFAKNELLRGQKEDRKHFFISMICRLTQLPVFFQLFEDEEHVRQLLTMFQLAEDCSNETIRSQLALTLQTIVGKQSVCEKLQQLFTKELLPLLIGKILKSNHNDMRFAAMNCLRVTAKAYLGEETLYSSGVFSETTKKVTSLLSEHLVPNLGILLAGNATVAAMTLGLVNHLFDISAVFLNCFHQHCGFRVLLPFVKDNLNAIKAVQCYVGSGLLKQEEKTKLIQPVLQLLKGSVGDLQTYLQYPLQILKHIVQQCNQEQIVFIWSVVLPLQIHQDQVIQTKARTLIRVIILLPRLPPLQWTFCDHPQLSSNRILFKEKHQLK